MAKNNGFDKTSNEFDEYKLNRFVEELLDKQSDYNQYVPILNKNNSTIIGTIISNDQNGLTFIPNEINEIVLK
ncbi:MAG TPA: hypothetical protein PLW93_06045 [Candidatus Absconditabacterales bacterium]|nr:hypothetical protein [Candidatus Absconditabacterales bacterium]HNG97809.1 hypothetical protein [Candidatus Absconditabacterales bacterium]